MIVRKEGVFHTPLSEAEISITDLNGGLVPPSYYTVSESVEVSATIINRKQITVPAETVLPAGTPVFVTVNGERFSNIVNSQVDLTITLSERLNAVPGACTVEKRKNSVTLKSDFKTGVYIIVSNQEKLVVRDGFCNPYLTLSDLGKDDALNVGYGEEVNANEVALQKIYADLGTASEEVYKSVFFSKIWELKRWAMLCILLPNNTNYQQMYTKALENIRGGMIRDDDTGVVTAKTSLGKFKGF